MNNLSKLLYQLSNYLKVSNILQNSISFNNSDIRLYNVSKTVLCTNTFLKMSTCTMMSGSGGKKVADLIKKGINIPNNIIPVSPVKPKLPVLLYNTNKIANQINHNYTFKKYLPIYEKNGVLIPHVIETFLSSTISGQYTLPPLEYANLINKNEEDIYAHSYIFTRYILTMYGGDPIPNIENILARVKQLFTEDVFSNHYPYPENFIQGNKALFPLLQHWLTFDTYHMRFPTKIQKYPSNLNISQKELSLQRNLELQILLKTHAFKFDENKDEIRFIDIQNKVDYSLIQKNAAIIQAVTKQNEPEMLGQCVIGLNQKCIYPIDAKLVGYPEKNLALFSSYGSLSPLYQELFFAERIKGILSEKIYTKPGVKQFIGNRTEDLSNLIFKYKRGSIEKEVFNESFNEWIKNLFNNNIKTNNVLFDGVSYMPSIISQAFSLNEHNYFQKIQKENPEKLHLMIKDISTQMSFEKYFPTYKQMQAYDFYDNNLHLMLVLKKYNLLENFYTMRTLLNNIDVL